MYCYLEFKLRYLKNLKLFSIRVKQLFEPIVSYFEGKNAMGFLLFLKFLSWETDLWVTKGNGNRYLSENWLRRNKMWCAADNHNYIYVSDICAKGLLDSSFNFENIKFSRNCPKFHIFTKNHNFLKYNWKLIDQMPSTLTDLMAGTYEESTFWILPVVSC